MVVARASRSVATVLLGAALAGSGTAPASSSGFAIREQSGSFQGLSFAGVAAGGRDIGTLYFNPATLTRHDGIAAHLSASYIVPRARFRDGVAAGGAVTGSDGGNIAADAVVPAAYAMLAAGDLRFGLGITAPFGLETDAPKDWIGRYHATNTKLRTINLNPTVAYRIDDKLSVGGGFVAQYADATLARAIFTGGPDAQSEVTGTDWDYGFTLGLLYQPTTSTRIGLGYRSQINHSLDGDLRLTAASGAVLRATGGRAALQTPQIASLGVAHAVNDRWSVLGTVEWTGWSTFDKLIVTFDDGGAPSVTEENWRDTWFFALGTEYRPRQDLVLQIGVAHDMTPNQDAYRTPRIPDANRTWISLGADWQAGDWFSLGAGYSRIFVGDGAINLVNEPALAPLSGNKGTLTGRFENAIDIVTVQGTLRF